MNRVNVPARQATEAGGIHSLESIPGLHKRLKIRGLYTVYTVQTLIAGLRNCKRHAGQDTYLVEKRRKKAGKKQERTREKGRV